MDSLNRWQDNCPNLETVVKVADNGYKQYLKSRSSASSESVKRAKKLQKDDSIGTHILLANKDITEQGEAAADILEQMKKFRPNATIFEIGNTAKDDRMKNVMANKRQKHAQVIDKVKLNKTQNASVEEDEPNKDTEALTESTQDDINSGEYLTIKVVGGFEYSRLFNAKWI